MESSDQHRDGVSDRHDRRRPRIARDAEGDLWVVDDADGLVEVAPDGNKKQDVGVAGSSGRDIAAGSDGRVWWADFGGQ